MSVAAGTLGAAAAALCFGVGLPLQARRARALPDLRVSPTRAALAFLRDGRWIAASALVAAGWGFELAALARAPAALVFPTAAAGIAIAAVLSARGGERLSRADALGVALALAGVACGSASVESDAGVARMHVAALATIAAALCVSALALLLARSRSGELIAAGTAGLLYSGSGLFTKALGTELETSAGFVAEAACLGLVALFAASGAWCFQVALQRGRTTVAAAWCTAISSLLPALAAGPAFGEAWPSGTRGAARAASLVAFGLAFMCLYRSARASGAGGAGEPAEPG